MENLNKKSVALASGFTASIIYLCCFIIMNLLGKESLIKLSNLLFHGVDFSTIIRMDISIGESLFGLILTFIFWSIIGLIFSFIYNKISNKR